MNHAQLKVLIDSDPANAAKSDAQILSWLKETITVQHDATNGDVLGWAVSGDVIGALETFTTNGNDTVRGLAHAALARVRAGLGLSLSQPDIQALLSTMVTAGMLTQAQVDALNETAQTTQYRYAAAGFRFVDDASWLHHIGIARDLP